MRQISFCKKRSLFSLFNLGRYRSVSVLMLLSPLVLEIRHLSIFCGFNSSLFLLSFIQQTLSLPYFYLGGLTSCAALCAVLLAVLVCCLKSHDIILTTRKKKKNQRREKIVGGFLPSAFIQHEPLHCTWEDVCVAGVGKLDLLPAPVQQVTVHAGEERWLLGFRRSLLCFALPAKRICSGL